MQLVIWSNTKENFLWESEKMNVKFHKITSYTLIFRKFTSVFKILVNFDIHFHSMKNFLWCYYRWLITSIALEKCKKNAIFFKLFWYKVFLHWKLKLLNFLVDSVLILTEFSEAVMTCLKLLLYFTHITASLWVVIMSFDDILKNTTNVRDLKNQADVR